MQDNYSLDEVVFDNQPFETRVCTKNGFFMVVRA